MYAIYIKYTKKTEYGNIKKIFMAVDIEQVKAILIQEINNKDPYYTEATISSTFHTKIGKGYFQKV